MTTIKATCPLCGDVDLAPRDVRVVDALTAGWASYEFTCPQCQELVHKGADAEVVQLLAGAGVRVDHLDIPAEALEPHDGPPIGYDDVLDFVLHLGIVDALASVVAAEIRA
ncbi:MAG: hypothetical protein R2737_10635 [Candidatus Nanopelagicales bacterium]